MNIAIGLLLFALIVTIIASVFILLYRKRNEKLEEEFNREILYSYTAGGRITQGIITTKLSYPFIQIRLYEDFFVVSYAKKILLYYSEITSMKNTIFGLKLNHDNRNYPEKI